MKSTLHGSKWDDLTLKNTQEAWQDFNSLLRESTMKHKPVAKIGRHRVARPQWLNEHTLMLVKKKALIFKRYHHLKSEED